MKRYIILFSVLYLIKFATCVSDLHSNVDLNERWSFDNKKKENLIEQEEDEDGLFLTDYIESGKIEEGVKKARVRLPKFPDVESYSGLLTINKEYNTNVFFWFFPSQTNPESDPLMSWMIGGPGNPVVHSIFSYNGPIQVKDDYTGHVRDYSYNTNHSLLYIDGPIGSGFSFTDDKAGYSFNATSTATDVLDTIKQFFQLFPKYRKNKFIVGGDSYAGKYVITIADAIHEYNKIEKANAINLGGLVIGNGIIYPHKQTVKADFLYQLGLFDENQRDQFKAEEVNPSGKTQLLAELFQNFTGFLFTENILYPLPQYGVNYIDWLIQKDTRKALHVSLHREFFFRNNTVFYNTTDKGQSVIPLVEKLLEEYKILFYNGQLDSQAPYTSSLEVYRNLNWSGAEKYKSAERKKIYYNEDLAGYWKVADNLNDVLIRNAGHVASYEQLLWCSKILTEFTHSN